MELNTRPAQTHPVTTSQRAAGNGARHTLHVTRYTHRVSGVTCHALSIHRPMNHNARCEVSTHYLHTIYTISTQYLLYLHNAALHWPRFLRRSACAARSSLARFSAYSAQLTIHRTLDIMQHGVLNHNILPVEWQLASFCQKCSRYDQK